MKNDAMEAKLKRAKAQVLRLKKFYRHLRAYLVVNIILLTIKWQFFDFVAFKAGGEHDLGSWFGWNLLATPVLWGVGLGVHAVYVFIYKAKPEGCFKPAFVKEWEERKLKELMDRE
ncbi:2TM domain-containing protein [Maribacter sp. 2307ULW6-5]|uniref:2TM domain-containing protein n=1 Tax=Maribacter sp. 2307ULW6-5 TaxID=3386275 RepID=UPI0039BD2579